MIRASRHSFRCGKVVRASTDAAPIQAAVASVGQSPAEAAAWYVDLCEEAYAKYCATALEPLAAGAHGQEHVPGAIHACFAWLCERYAMLGGAEHGGLCLPEAGAPLLLRCQTQFTLAMHGAVLEALPAYFSHVLRETHGTILADSSGVQVAAQLRVLGLATLVQGMLTSTATRLLENAVRRETGASTVRLAQTLQHAAFPAMHDMLQHQLMPALTALLDARPHGLPLADEAPRDVWDVSVSHIHDESMRTVAPAPDHESLYLRLEYGLSRALGHVRYVVCLTQTRAAVRNCGHVSQEPCGAGRSHGTSPCSPRRGSKSRTSA